MRDQVRSITAMGITATYISDKEAAGSKERKQAIKNGMFQIVFISPEALVWAQTPSTALRMTLLHSSTQKSKTPPLVRCQKLSPAKEED